MNSPGRAVLDQGRTTDDACNAPEPALAPAHGLGFAFAEPEAEQLDEAPG
jgi:hypothetical protein